MAAKVRQDTSDERGKGATPLAEYRRKRDFSRTPEPEGQKRTGQASELGFVIQRHAARQLHFDLRLELGGVMKSWAVPKGPSLDPSVKRLAIEVEDHPMEYNTFEGIIPEGEYGGGTVMLWDRGTYSVEGSESRRAAEKQFRDQLRKGKLSLTFHGERLRGGFTLVRSRITETDKPQWLLIKHDDEFADPERDVVAEMTDSIESGRTMDEIAEGRGERRVWRRGGEDASGNVKRTGRVGTRQARHTLQFSPMLATSAQQAPEDGEWSYEPKWDGIRIVAFATTQGSALITRNGIDKRRQFPEVAQALQAFSARTGRPMVLDGEIVATHGGRIVRFEALQGRMHTQQAAEIQQLADDAPAALVTFDILLDDEEVLVHRPWIERRAHLEAVFSAHSDARLRLGETSRDREALFERAREEGWEGLIAKRVDASYEPGKRSRAWLKLKIENRQEFVVGGWTEPRNTRKHIGALLLGYYDESGALIYAGHTGTGLTADDLSTLYSRLKPLERKTAPFSETPETNERPHWTTPRIVVEVRFNEWTRKGILRQPVFIGVRDDKPPREVVREPITIGAAMRPGNGEQDRRNTGAPGEHADDGQSRKRSPRSVAARKGSAAAGEPSSLLEQLQRLEGIGGSGTIRIRPDVSLDVSNLDKIFFPRIRKTKGDLLRYYAAVADHLLPFMRDRPLVLKRFPNGESGTSFYQQNAPESVPQGIRVEVLKDDNGEAQRRFVGGDLITLLYTIQLGSISYDPWHSRIGRLEFPDYTILDLDPGPGATFRTVVQVAHAVKEEMDGLRLRGALKTSGSTGLHVYLPLPPRTPLDAATLVAQIIATRVADRHPKIATVARMTRNRPRGTVYVDYLQNILGKTVAGVYAVRAKPRATVSTPIDWSELTDDLDPSRFTIDTIPPRIAKKGDLWGPAMRSRNQLSALLRER